MHSRAFGNRCSAALGSGLAAPGFSPAGRRMPSTVIVEHGAKLANICRFR